MKIKILDNRESSVGRMNEIDIELLKQAVYLGTQRPVTSDLTHNAGLSPVISHIMRVCRLWSHTNV